MSVEFFVRGPVPTQGSMRVFVSKNGKASTRHTKADAIALFRAEVRVQAERISVQPVPDPVSVSIWAYIARPKSHYRTGKNAHLLRANAPEFPTYKTDADKIARAVNDALSLVAFDDDGQVVDLHVYKRWAGLWQPGTRIVIGAPDDLR